MRLAKNCPNCTMTLPREANFCRRCGTALRRRRLGVLFPWLGGVAIFLAIIAGFFVFAGTPAPMVMQQPGVREQIQVDNNFFRPGRPDNPGASDADRNR